MSKILFLFPGQGAQYPGIGSDLIASYDCVKRVYDTASSILGYDIAEVSQDETTDRIHLTRYTQPVLLTHSYACMQVFLQQHTGAAIQPSYACGHSLGEYSALVAADCLSFEDALKLVSRRGELMGEHGGGEMLALALSEQQLSAHIESSECEIAACNLIDQTVVGGWPDALDRLQSQLEKHFPGKSGIRLKTEGAFHTSHMRPAADSFVVELQRTVFNRPQFSVGSNVTGTFHETDEDSIRNNLFLQLFQPVKWHSNLTTIAESGVDTIIEFGGGLGQGSNPSEKRPNLAGMIARAFRRVKPRPAYYSVISEHTLQNTLAQLKS